MSGPGYDPRRVKIDFFDTFLRLAFTPGREDLERRELYGVKKRAREDTIPDGWGAGIFELRENMKNDEYKRGSCTSGCWQDTCKLTGCPAAAQ